MGGGESVRPAAFRSLPEAVAQVEFRDRSQILYLRPERHAVHTRRHTDLHG